MKKLISIILVVVLSGISNLLIFADNNMNDLSYINLRPKHTVALPGDDSLYYGYINLNEDFSTNNLNYTTTVDFDISNVKIETGIKGDCTIIGNKEYDLKVGQNIVNLIITKPDGISKTYTITITRNQDPKDDNNLSWLSIVTYNNNHPVKITPNFNKDILNYNANVENDVSKINISCMDNNNSLLGGDYSLKTGENKIEIPVISKSGLSKIYTFNIFREKSSDNTFFSIDIDEYDSKNIKFKEESINYNPQSLGYLINVPYDAASISTSVACDANANSIVKGYGRQNLIVGANKINITIVAENGSEKPYTIIVNRAKPSAELDSLKINEYYCGTDQKEYKLDVNYSTTNANINAIAENRLATVTGNGQYNLKVGTNKFTITVKSVNGAVKKYPIIINRLKQSKAKVIIIWTIIK